MLWIRRMAGPLGFAQPDGLRSKNVGSRTTGRKGRAAPIALPQDML
jgi:hypothetical protein